MDLIEGLVRDVMTRRHDAIEAMCERSLVDPRGYGVLVDEGGLGDFTVSLSPDVPFQEIHYKSQGFHGTFTD